jgi:molybdopterin synthase catalytic subunit
MNSKSMFIEGAISELKISSHELTSDGLTGAEVCFAGRVRGDQYGQAIVKSIEFTAQESLSISIAETILHESTLKFGILGGQIFHSLGEIPVGEICFLVNVQGQHRNESFAALIYIVDEVKKRCPIFGREIFDDGTYQWKTNKK